ncbi:MAG: hypothetical protein OEY34_09885, partial [Cyclobacteriaceae bacterium]|nr:hypothetical protein [Cyclobacteriaceae bacterium]
MISKSIIRYKTKSGSKKNSELRDSPSYRNSQLIGILFCVEDIEKHQSVKHLIKTFEHDNKKVQVLTYLPKDKDNYEFLFDFYSKKDFTFLGNFE